MATTSGIKAGKAYVIIEALDKTSSVLNTVGGKFKGFADKISGMGQKMLMGSLAGLTPSFLSAKTFMEFDDAMRKVEARADGTASEMDKLREVAKGLGMNSAFTATQVGELQGNLAQMGFNRGQIASMTGGIVALAQAGGEGKDAMLDAANAANLVAGTLRSYKMEASASTEVADIMTTALNATNLTMDDLITSLSYAGPIAKQYNVSLLDTVTVLGQLRNLNIDASTAGTSFRNMLLEMSDPKVREEFNGMLKAATGNTITFVDAANNLRPLPDLLFEIGEATKNMGTAQQGDIFNTLFGKRAIVPAEAVAMGKNAFMEIRAAMGNFEGSAERTGKVMQGGLGGVFRRFKGAIEGIAISIGETLAPSLIELGNKVGVFLRNFIPFIMENRNAIILFTGLMVAGVALGVSLIALGYTIGALGTIIAAVGTAFGIASSIIGFFLTPVGLVVAGVALLVAGLVALVIHIYNTNEAFRTWVASVGTYFAGFFEGLLATAQTTIGGIIEAIAGGNIQQAWDIALAGLYTAWLQFGNNLSTKWENLIGGIADYLIDTLVAAIDSVFNLIQEQTHINLKGILEAGGASTNTLTGFQQAYQQNAKAMQAERQREIDLHKKELGYTIKGNSKTATSIPEMQPSAIAASIGEAMAVPAMATPNVPSLIQGLERGSVEAAKAFAENKANGGLVAKTLEVAAKSFDALKSIDRHVADIDLAAI